MISVPITIDLVSDVTCPWCIVGFKKLEQALGQTEFSQPVSIQWQPFELNPGLPPQGELLLDNLQRKYNMSKADSENFSARLKSIGESLDFEFNIGEDFRMYDTKAAHRLLTWAQQFNLQTELKLKLFQFNFSESLNISDTEILLSACEAVGLNVEEARAALDDELIRKKTDAEQQFWLQSGIQSVPSIILNRKYLINGAQEPEQIAKVFEKINSEALTET
ncbi:DsbA family oxidoreductase [Sessilibacter corallicola]|uniref:DsbA family oxidoreductase n=1 Tax=Sessilibacter corallicola TaxID=2904075 RepID=UPI001E37C3DD|nr:DsbA family oxidoreductase [Sessilibacter corallicola]MCE2027522.1 DsbA family oxidoreductase [Sessilibacter corallicola]